MKNQEAITQLVMSGYDVDFGPLSVSNIGNHVQMRNRMFRKYQVDCTSGKFIFSEMYDDLEIAVDKFMAIRNILLKRSK